ncbi:MAG: transposase [Candidatus Stahlbacteria bacterium]|nr:transposase [Candidatus Stahlbacteria bacterium]
MVSEKRYKRKSIRLKDYDYSQPGAYFITICTNKRVCLLGSIENGGMILNDTGRIVEKWWLKLPDKFPNIELDIYGVMPNHLHGIIFIINNVGADPCVCPEIMNKGEHIGSPLQITLAQMVKWVKTMSTNEYIRNVKHNDWQPFLQKFWQRNYYEHIIRNEKELNYICEYIYYNPLK